MKYTKDEIDKYNAQISKVFVDFCEEKNMAVRCETHTYRTPKHSFMLFPDRFKSENFKMLNAKTYFKEHVFFDYDLKIVSPIEICDLAQKHLKPEIFWEYIDNKLDTKGKVLFNRFMTKKFEAHAFQSLIAARNDEQKWFYIKHIHDGERKSGTQGEFNTFFDFIKTQELNTADKIENFYLLCKHSRNILKIPEYNQMVCNFISLNISQEHHEMFEVLLGKKVKRQIGVSEPSDIMVVNASQTMQLQKDKCYDKFNFSSETKLNLTALNYLNHCIVRALKEKCSPQLDISDIMIVPFTSENNFSKIIFDFNRVEHRTDMPEIYVALVAQCAPIYTDQKDNYENIEKNVISAVNHYLLDKNLTNTDKKSQRVKI